MLLLWVCLSQAHEDSDWLDLCMLAGTVSRLLFVYMLSVIGHLLKVLLGRSGFCVSHESVAGVSECGDAPKWSIRMHTH